MITPTYMHDPLLAHGLTMKLSPCPCSHTSPGMNSCMSSCVVNYMWAFQNAISTCSGSLQDDAAFL